MNSFQPPSNAEDHIQHNEDEITSEDEPTNGLPSKTSAPRVTTSKDSAGWRRVVRNFPPSFFSINMGTGITSILLHNLPYNGQWLQYISYIVFALNVALFVVFLGISIVRYTLYPEIWRVMIRHPTQSLFIGTFPMGLATIVNMVVFACVPAWGGSTWKLAWALWWIDAAIAVATCCYLPFVMYLKPNNLHSRLSQC